MTHTNRLNYDPSTECFHIATSWPNVLYWLSIPRRCCNLKLTATRCEALRCWVSDSGTLARRFHGNRESPTRCHGNNSQYIYDLYFLFFGAAALLCNAALVCMSMRQCVCVCVYCIPCDTICMGKACDWVDFAIVIKTSQFTWPCPRPQPCPSCPLNRPTSDAPSSTPTTRNKEPGTVTHNYAIIFDGATGRVPVEGQRKSTMITIEPKLNKLQWKKVVHTSLSWRKLPEVAFINDEEWKSQQSSLFLFASANPC